MGAARLVERLTALAEAQRVAAIGFDTEAMDTLTRERADALFELQIELQDGLSAAERAEVAQLLPAYERAEHRLARVVGVVAQTLGPVQRTRRTATYGRSGRIRGR